MIIHAGTNNATIDSLLKDIYMKNLTSIKHGVKSFLPNCDAITNNIIERRDEIKAPKTCDQVNSSINSAKVKFLLLGNSTINDKHLKK